MGYIPYVGFATHQRATVRTRLCLYKIKIKNKKGHHIDVIRIVEDFPYQFLNESKIGGFRLRLNWWLSYYEDPSPLSLI